MEQKLEEEKRELESIKKQQREFDLTLAPSAYAMSREQQVEQETMITRSEFENAQREYRRSIILCILTITFLVISIALLLMHLRYRQLI